MSSTSSNTSSATSGSANSAAAADWLEGARPHTWANAIAPVFAGTAAAMLSDSPSFPRALLALVVALSLIIGVNYANDYSDGIRGTDEDRTGPLRLTGSGLVEPKRVKYAAFLCFSVAGIAGIALSLLSSWWLILIGALCIAGAWFYTGGKNPYGYRGLGEVAVFIFFGLVAVLGTEFTQSGHVTWLGLAMAVTIGALSSSVNLANNLRDIPTDAESGKITLAVRLGDKGTRTLWLSLVGLSILLTIVLGVFHWPTIFALLSCIFLINAAKPIWYGAEGKALIPVLGLTGRGMLVWSIIVLITALF